VKGVLRDPEGQPLPGETVVCRHWSSSRQGTAVTGSDGSFEVSCPVPVGEKAILYLTASDHVLAQPKSEEHLGSWDLRFLEDF
ncbi:carboxypeptidase regulatory-like domain-containing protein, partial [Citrobacter sp. AAK_AS5]